MAIVLVVLCAVALAAGTYWGLERLGRPGLVPGALRAIAGIAIGLLLLDLSCARPVSTLRPVVVLDASISMGRRWAEALATARGLGDVRLVGSIGPDSSPAGGVSQVAPSVIGAVSLGRPVWLVSDGEITDRGEVLPEVWGQVGTKVFPRARHPDLALTRVSGPERIASGDTLRIEVDVSGAGVADRKQVAIEVRSGDVRWLSGTVPLSAGSGTATLDLKIGASIPAGPHLLVIALKDAGDDEPDTDSRLMALTVLPTPGIVLVASPGDWESRFLFKTISEVAALPVRGFLALDQSRWVRMGDFAVTSATEVEQAVARADVLIQIGDRSDRLKRSRARGRWDWVSTSKVAAPAEGDWYLGASGASPVAGAFVGLPVDSFPPAIGLSTLAPGPHDWVGLTAQQNRRGIERPAVIGRDSAGRREVLVGAAGLWRWAFRGGSSDQAYRAWVASTISWLLGGADSATGSARPIASVVQRGRPFVFERLRPDSALRWIELKGPTGSRIDTLKFDGAGRAEFSLPPGRYDYRLQGGGAGVLGVERYSDELLPRPVVLADHPAIASSAATRDPIRDKWWLFGVAILALGGEWWWRRRSGLR